MGGIELNKIYCGDALTVLKTFPDECVDTCVTSPPYWRLRDYGVEGQIGLEETPEEYIEKLVVIFREVRRVLKKTGTLWLNMGDSYGQSYRWGKERNKWHSQKRSKGEEIFIGTKPLNIKLKPKNLLGIPWHTAFALQVDGWNLIQDIIFAKSNPMPESITHRCTKAHEYVFLMSKSEKYFYDAYAIREPAKVGYDSNGVGFGHGTDWLKRNRKRVKGEEEHSNFRNKRSVWFISTEPFYEAHYATFPKALVEPCIKAGTSENGNCPKCGKPWERVLKKLDKRHWTERGDYSSSEKMQALKATGLRNDGGRDFLGDSSITIGWRPTCSCGIEEAVPAVVLDTFMGSGTVGLVAKYLGRNYIGIEINPEYVKMAERRINGELFAG